MINFRILGPFSVLRDETPLPIQGGKERAALAILLLNAGQVVSADHMIDALWESEAPATARNSLHVRIAALRKTLGSTGQQRRAHGPSGSPHGPSDTRLSTQSLLRTHSAFLIPYLLDRIGRPPLGAYIATSSARAGRLASGSIVATRPSCRNTAAM